MILMIVILWNRDKHGFKNMANNTFESMLRFHGSSED